MWEQLLSNHKTRPAFPSHPLPQPHLSTRWCGHRAQQIPAGHLPSPPAPKRRPHLRDAGVPTRSVAVKSRGSQGRRRRGSGCPVQVALWPSVIRAHGAENSPWPAGVSPYQPKDLWGIVLLHGQSTSLQTPLSTANLSPQTQFHYSWNNMVRVMHAICCFKQIKQHESISHIWLTVQWTYGTIGDGCVAKRPSSWPSGFVCK